MARKKTQYELRKKADDPSYKRKEGNLPAKKYKHTNPTQLRLSFEFQGNQTQFIDIAQALSAINRKLARQHAYYYVNSVELYNNEDAFVDLHVVPDTWVVRNAVTRGKAIFDNMNELVTGNRRSILPKYHDFKVYMSNLHRTTGTTPPSLHNINSAATGYPSDEWAYSQLVSADDDGDANQQADNFYLHILGGHSGSSANWESVGLVRSYAEGRARSNATNPVVDAGSGTTAGFGDPLMNLLDFSSEEQINDIATRLDEDNDAAPYDLDQYIGEASGSMQQVARLVTTATNGRVTTAPGFCAPFGLICVDPQSTATAFRLVINLAPGTYHGTYAERV
jgi:hypothetical protein